MQQNGVFLHPAMQAVPLTIQAALGPLALPTIEQSKVIQQMFEHNRDKFQETASKVPIPCGAFLGPNGQAVFVDRDGRVHRTLCLDPVTLYGHFSSRPIPGLELTTTSEPLLYVFNDRIVQMGTSIVSNLGHLVTADIGCGLLAKDFNDPCRVAYGEDQEHQTVQSIIKEHIPRPPNAFILFRNAKVAEVKINNPGISNNDISRVVGQLWRNADAQTKESYQTTARELAEKHRQQHPEYKYTPRRSHQIRRRVTAGGLRRARPAHPKQRLAIPSFIRSVLPKVAQLQEEWAENPSPEVFAKLMAEYDNIISSI